MPAQLLRLKVSALKNTLRVHYHCSCNSGISYVVLKQLLEADDLNQEKSSAI
jgi:hypothetical protein